ncbi:MAG: c-type cytochrome [Candidatus Thorarchaeota archaeon]|jgi:hypothetical protein
MKNSPRRYYINLLVITALLFISCTSATVGEVETDAVEDAVEDITEDNEVTQVEKEATTPNSIDKGEQLYSANCQVCHGDREGQETAGGASPLMIQAIPGTTRHTAQRLDLEREVFRGHAIF